MTSMSASESEPVSRLDGLHILVVDDNEDARAICEQLLKHAGAMVRVVGSALSAARTLRHLRPDVIVSDLSMPRNDGLWLIDWIRTRDRERRDHLPVIALTARDDLYDTEATEQRGFDLYLRKPVGLPELCRHVARLAAQSHRRAASA
jgi:CheY-like chemotaxis protein